MPAAYQRLEAAQIDVLDLRERRRVVARRAGVGERLQPRGERGDEDRRVGGGEVRIFQLPAEVVERQHVIQHGLFERADVDIPHGGALARVLRGLQLRDVVGAARGQIVDEDRDGVTVVFRGVDFRHARDRDEPADRRRFELRFRAAARQRPRASISAFRFAVSAARGLFRGALGGLVFPVASPDRILLSSSRRSISSSTVIASSSRPSRRSAAR
jgi:hypothetical protein